MVRVVRLTILWMIAILCVAGCSSRKLLSDKELAQIFHDAFITNAYVTSEKFTLDSLRIYEPIFQKYGYTTEDVQYSIGSFSTRKSARLGDVVERAISMLEAEGQVLDRQVAVLDTIDNIAQRRSQQLVMSEEFLELRQWSDTSSVIFTINNISPGNYAVNFEYRIDSLSSVDGYSFDTWIETLNPDNSYRRTSSNTSQLSPYGVAQMTRSIKVLPNQDRLAIRLAMPQKHDEESDEEIPSLTIKNLSIRYIPAVEQAHEQNLERMIPIRVFNNRFYHVAAQNSI